ncbi:MAG TPA: type I-U CRISPR-associated protein Csb2 [Candidatus Sulfotelmatobacter sp.]|nr:type I-U CRISPR-associated protein Csb2 [Candidatus Sulfotelmatobacter sp.]
MLRVDVKYLTGSVHASQFPLDASTLFQAMVQRNAYRLDEVRPALEALERSNCLRIECTQMTKTDVSIAVPRMPKLTEMRQFIFSDPGNKLMTRQPVFRFSEKDAIHLSYFFDADAKEEWLPFYEPFRLGHGESLCVAKAKVIGSLPGKTTGMQAWEPTQGRGRQMRTVRTGLLNDLILYHDARKSSTEVEQKVVTFSTTDERERRIMYHFYRDGKFHAFPAYQLPAVAGMMRHAVMNKMRTAELKEYASNHGDRQLQYVPLPTVGHTYADGRIRRAVIVEAIGQKMLPIHSVSELVLIDQQTGQEIARAVRQTDADSTFELYTKPSKKWISVTPVLLAGFDTKHGKKNERKRQKMLRTMFMHAGLPAPRSIETFASEGAKFKVSNKHGKNYIKTMLAVEFENEIAGMVVVGAGRNAGMGVFANLA